MTTLQVPLSAPMYQYLDRKLYREAYEVACMGVTEADWSELAHEPVNALELDIAKQAFQRIQDYKYLELMESIANQKRLGGPQANINHNVFIGDILAWQGKFNEAARLNRKCGRSDKAVALFTEFAPFQSSPGVSQRRQYDRTDEHPEKRGRIGRKIFTIREPQQECT